MQDKFQQYRQAVLKILKEIESTQDGHVECKRVFKLVEAHLKDVSRPVHSVLYPAGPTSMQFTAYKINDILEAKVIERQLRGRRHL